MQILSFCYKFITHPAGYNICVILIKILKVSKLVILIDETLLRHRGKGDHKVVDKCLNGNSTVNWVDNTIKLRPRNQTRVKHTESFYFSTNGKEDVIYSADIVRT